MTTETHMTTMLDVSQVKKSPGDGALIYGIYIEGARWLTGEDAGDIDDVTGVPTQGYLAPSRLKELLPKVPVIYMKAVVVEPQWEPSSVGYMRHNPAVYDTPVYMTTFRKFKQNFYFFGILCNELFVHTNSFSECISLLPSWEK